MRWQLALVALLLATRPAAEPLLEPQLSPREARARFEAWLRDHDLAREHYRLQTLSYDYVTGEWTAFYLGRGDAFDDAVHLWRDREGRIELVP